MRFDHPDSKFDDPQTSVWGDPSASAKVAQVVEPKSAWTSGPPFELTVRDALIASGDLTPAPPHVGFVAGIPPHLLKDPQ